MVTEQQKIAAYVRVSTKDQKEDMQLNDIKNFCRFKGWDNVTFFIDRGESGIKVSRPEFDKMLTRIRNNDFNVVLCWSFDRISRSTLQLISLVQELNKLEIDFISLQQNIDTTTPMGELIFTMFAGLAQFERETIRQRTRAGITVAKANGIHCGRPEKYTDEDRNEVMSYYRDNVKPERIARLLGMDRATVFRIIKKKKNEN